MELIESAGLLKTVKGMGNFYERIVKEFLVNISSSRDDNISKKFKKVYVCGKCVEFSPKTINNYLGSKEDSSAKVEVSDNQIFKEVIAQQVKQWPVKEKLLSSKLSVNYALLHMIGAAKWMPTNHTSTISTVLGKFIFIVGTKIDYDFGSYIYDQTMKQAQTFTVKVPIAFSSIICGIILCQHPRILVSNDVVSKRESPLSSHYKLVKGTHVPDIVMTSNNEVARSTSKDGILAEPKDMSRTL